MSNYVQKMYDSELNRYKDKKDDYEKLLGELGDRINYIDKQDAKIVWDESNFNVSYGGNEFADAVQKNLDNFSTEIEDFYENIKTGRSRLCDAIDEVKERISYYEKKIEERELAIDTEEANKE